MEARDRYNGKCRGSTIETLSRCSECIVRLFSEITVINFSLYDLEVRASLSCQRDDGLITLSRWVLGKKFGVARHFCGKVLKAFEIFI